MIRRGLVLAILAVGAVVAGVARFSDSADTGSNVVSKAVYPPAQAIESATLAHANTQVFSIESAEAEIEALLDAEIPEESCIVIWDDAECPEVAEVEVTYTGEEDDADVGFMLPWAERSDDSIDQMSSDSLLASNRTGGDTTLAFHNASNFTCGIWAKKPWIFESVGDFWARTEARHHCSTGQGVSRMEMWGDLQRKTIVAPIRWATMDTCFRKRNGPGLQSCFATFDCYHPDNQRSYRGTAAGYVVRSGTGYFAVDYSPVLSVYCYE